VDAESKTSKTTSGVADTLAGYVSVNQLVSLGFTAVLGGLIAYYNHSWFTFTGAIFGLLLHISLFLTWERARTWGSRVVQRFGSFGAERLAHWLRPLLVRCLRFFCLVFLGNESGEEVYDATKKLVRRQGYLWGFFVEDSPPAKQRLVFSTLLKTPVYYARWAVVGLLMGSLIEVMLQRKELEDGMLLKLTTSLDLYLGLLVALSALRETLQDVGRHTLGEAQDAIPTAMANRMASITAIPQMSAGEARFELARLREAVRVKQFQIGQSFHNAWGLIENFYSLAIVGLVIFLISIPGGLLALVGVCSLIPSMLFELLQLQREERNNAVNRARRRALQQISEEPNWQIVLSSVAPPEAVSGLLNSISKEIRSVFSRDKTKQMVQRISARIVFFTLFALSTLFPVIATFNGELRPRVTLLYIFSMLGLWYAVSGIAEKASKLFEKVEDLAEVDEANERIKEDRGVAIAATTSPRLSSEITIDKVSFGYPFKPLLLRFEQTVRIPPTITLATTIRIFGRARSGKTTLLQLLSGNCQPTFGSIELGGSSLASLETSLGILYVPERVPVFPRIKLQELFNAFLNEDIEGKEVRRYLRTFGLIDDLYDESSPDWTGENLLIQFRDQYLDEVQERLLFYSLQFAALERRSKDGRFQPTLIAVDGLHRLPSLRLRQACFEAFKSIADSYCSSLIVTTDDLREIGNEDYVLSILEREDYPPKSKLVEKNGNLVTFGRHKDRWEHSDSFKKKRYRDYLRSVSAIR
jgi:ABC-type multidrug transport system fused ATPase/permease subunit